MFSNGCQSRNLSTRLNVIFESGFEHGRRANRSTVVASIHTAMRSVTQSTRTSSFWVVSTGRVRAPVHRIPQGHGREAIQPGLSGTGHKAFTLMFSEASSSAKQCFQTNQTCTIATVWHQHTLLGRRCVLPSDRKRDFGQGNNDRPLCNPRGTGIEADPVVFSAVGTASPPVIPSRPLYSLALHPEG